METSLNKYRELIQPRKASTKKLLEEFNQQCLAIKEASKKKIVDDDKENRINKSKNDFVYFCKTYLSHWMTHDFAKFHLETIEELQKRDTNIYLLEWARGLSKSTMMKFMLLWRMIRGELNNVVYISNSVDLTERIILALRSDLENNKLFIEDFGPFKEKGATWKVDNIVIPKYDCCIYGLGSGMPIRGILYKMYRPGLVIIDDIDDAETCRNKDRLSKLKDYFFQDVYGCVNPTEFQIIMIGNRFAPDMLLTEVGKIKGIFHKKINLIDEQGNIVWDRFSPKWVEQTKETLGPIRFGREYMNTPLIEGSIFKNENIIFKDIPGPIDRIICCIDPSWTATGDYKSSVWITPINDNFFVLKIFNRKCGIGQLVDHTYQTYKELLQYTNNIIIYFESVFNQGLLIKEFDVVRNEKGFSIPIVENNSVHKDKVSRIETLEPFFLRNKIIFHNDIQNEPDWKDALEHLLGFNRGSRLPDDFPDCLATCVSKCNTYTNQINSEILIDNSNYRLNGYDTY